MEDKIKNLLNDEYYKALMKAKAKIYETSPVKYIVNGEDIKSVYPKKTMELIKKCDELIEHRINLFTTP